MIKYDSSHPDYRQTWDEWSLRVDADGTPVPEGQESDNDYFARPPMPYRYLGTVDGLTPKAAKNNPKYKCTVSSPADKKAYEDRLRHTMFIVAQSNIGREKLQFAMKHGIKFQTRPDGVAAVGAMAINNPCTNTVWFGTTPDPLMVTRSTSHELEHAQKNIISNFYYDSSHSLKSAMATVEVQEPGARMSGALSVAELLFDAPGDHPRRWKPKSIDHIFDSDPPAFREAIMKAGRHIEQGNIKEFAFEVFSAALVDSRCNPYYQLNVIDSFRLWMPQRPVKRVSASNKNSYAKRMANYSRKSAQFMHRDWATQERIESAMTVLGVPYLKGRGLVLDQPVLSTDAKVRGAYNVLKTRSERYCFMQNAGPNLTLPLSSESRPAPRLLEIVAVEKPAVVEIRPAAIDVIPFQIPMPHWNIIPRPAPAVQLAASPQ